MKFEQYRDAFIDARRSFMTNEQIYDALQNRILYRCRACGSVWDDIPLEACGDTNCGGGPVEEVSAKDKLTATPTA